MLSHLVAKNFSFLRCMHHIKKLRYSEEYQSLIFYRTNKFYTVGFAVSANRGRLGTAAPTKQHINVKINKPYYSSSLKMLYAGEPSHCAGKRTPNNTAAVGVTSTSRGNNCISKPSLIPGPAATKIGLSVVSL